jgi:hypothetical protein
MSATPEVIYARAVSLALRSLPEKLRLKRIRAYLDFGIPSRYCTPVTGEAETILQTFEKLKAGTPAHVLISRSTLPRSDERSCRRFRKHKDSTATKRRKHAAAVHRWQSRRES